MQIVNIFLSIVRKPKRFLFCMFLFVVKWWEIPLEGSLVVCKWRAPFGDFSFRNRCRLFSVWNSTSVKVFPTSPLIITTRVRLSQLVRPRWDTLPSAFPQRDESHFTILELDFDVLKDFSFAREQTLRRLNANKLIVANTFKWFFLSNREGFLNNN